MTRTEMIDAAVRQVAGAAWNDAKYQQKILIHWLRDGMHIDRVNAVHTTFRRLAQSEALRAGRST